VRLGLGTLDAVAGPAFDPRELEVGIVHLGLGAFHRAHQAVYTEDAVVAEPGPWGICGASRRSRTVVDALNEQDGLYALLERGPDADRGRVVASVREALVAAAQPDLLRDRLAAETTHELLRRLVQDFCARGAGRAGWLGRRARRLPVHDGRPHRARRHGGRPRRGKRADRRP
jgi:hypothetical protein